MPVPGHHTPLANGSVSGRGCCPWFGPGTVFVSVLYTTAYSVGVVPIWAAGANR